MNSSYVSNSIGKEGRRKGERQTDRQADKQTDRNSSQDSALLQIFYRGRLIWTVSCDIERLCSFYKKIYKFSSNLSHYLKMNKIVTDPSKSWSRHESPIITNKPCLNILCRKQHIMTYCDISSSLFHWDFWSGKIPQCEATMSLSKYKTVSEHQRGAQCSTERFQSTEANIQKTLWVSITGCFRGYRVHVANSAAITPHNSPQLPAPIGQRGQLGWENSSYKYVFWVHWGALSPFTCFYHPPFFLSETL